MTVKEAIEYVQRYQSHIAVFVVADDGTVFVGGNNHYDALRSARKQGHRGPAIRVFENGFTEPA